MPRRVVGRADPELTIEGASLHNLRFYLRLLERARAAIAAGTLASLRAEVEAVGESPV